MLVHELQSSHYVSPVIIPTIIYIYIYIYIYTVDGKYNQSGNIPARLNCGFRGPPYPLISMLGYSRRVVLSIFCAERVNIEDGGGGGEKRGKRKIRESGNVKLL